MSDPTNGELALMMSESDRRQTELLVEVREQTKKTNGRVSKLEDWRSMIIGGLIVTNIIFVPIILAIIIKLFNQFFSK